MKRKVKIICPIEPKINNPNGILALRNNLGPFISHVNSRYIITNTGVNSNTRRMNAGSSFQWFLVFKFHI